MAPYIQNRAPVVIRRAGQTAPLPSRLDEANRDGDFRVLRQGLAKGVDDDEWQIGLEIPQIGPEQGIGFRSRRARPPARAERFGPDERGIRDRNGPRVGTRVGPRLGAVHRKPNRDIGFLRGQFDLKLVGVDAAGQREDRPGIDPSGRRFAPLIERA